MTEESKIPHWMSRSGTTMIGSLLLHWERLKTRKNDFLFNLLTLPEYHGRTRSDEAEEENRCRNQLHKYDDSPDGCKNPKSNSSFFKIDPSCKRGCCHYCD